MINPLRAFSYSAIVRSNQQHPNMPNMKAKVPPLLSIHRIKPKSTKQDVTWSEPGEMYYLQKEVNGKVYDGQARRDRGKKGR